MSEFKKGTSSKTLEKLRKALDAETVDSINNMPPEELKAAVIAAEVSIKQTAEELEANPKYQELKENLKAISQGLREVKKRQNAIIQYALHRLEE